MCPVKRHRRRALSFPPAKIRVERGGQWEPVNPQSAVVIIIRSRREIATPSRREKMSRPSRRVAQAALQDVANAVGHTRPAIIPLAPFPSGRHDVPSLPSRWSSWRSARSEILSGLPLAAANCETCDDSACPAAPLHGLRRVKIERWGKEHAHATPRLIASILLGSSGPNTTRILSDFILAASRFSGLRLIFPFSTEFFVLRHFRSRLCGRCDISHRSRVPNVIENDDLIEDPHRGIRSFRMQRANFAAVQIKRDSRQRGEGFGVA